MARTLFGHTLELEGSFSDPGLNELGVGWGITIHAGMHQQVER